MTEIHCSGVLFDLDGVLIDSTPAVTRVWRQWAMEHGFDPEEVVARVHGRPSLATVREYLPNADHAAENREIERREMRDADGIITLPGARELLLQLPAKRWTIATSCTRSLAEVRLRAAGLIDGNIPLLVRHHREVSRYRKAMSDAAALAALTGPPESWR